VKIRAFQHDDHEAVVALWEQCGLTVSWNDPGRDIERKLQVQPELFLVAVEADAVIGSAMGGYDGHRGSLYYLAVAPEYRGRGVGSMLVKELSRMLQEMGCPKLNIMVRASNSEVIGFYENLGFATDEIACMGRRLISDETR